LNSFFSYSSRLAPSLGLIIYVIIYVKGANKILSIGVRKGRKEAMDGERKEGKQNH